MHIFTSPYCFVAGTAILTGAGYVAIENIKKGDHVWSSNPDTGETALKEVLQTYVNETDELIHVTVDGEEIVTTPSHPFYVPKQGWTDAIHLKAGDILLTVNGEYVVVEKVQHELLEAPIKVYNFEVEGFHTYYVGDGDGVLVHNACRDFQTKSTKQESIKFSSEREARNFARNKVGHNPIKTGPNKLVSQNGKWQYRAKPGDLADGHIHLEKLNPKTGEVLINYHLRWQ